MSYATIITKLGKAAISKAIADREQISLTKMGVGQSKDVISDEWETLPEEAQKFSISDIRVKEDDANIVIVQGILEASVGGFVIRQVGIYGADDKLFAVANVPETIKPRLSEGAAKDLTINFYIALSDTGVINLTVEESSKFASRRYVDTKFDAALVETKANELYAPKTHNHDEVYLKIEDFEKYKNQKSAEEGEFLNKFIKDPTNEKWTRKFFYTADKTDYPIMGGLVLINDKYAITKAQSSKQTLSPVFTDFTPYFGAYEPMAKINTTNSSQGEFKYLFCIGDEHYFGRKMDTSFDQDIYVYNSANGEWKKAGGTILSNDAYTSYIAPKYPLWRSRSYIGKIYTTDDQEVLDFGSYSHPCFVIDDYVIRTKINNENPQKVFKISKSGKKLVSQEVALSDTPFDGFDIYGSDLIGFYIVAECGEYFRNGDDFYYIRYFRTSSTNFKDRFKIYKNKELLSCPIPPIAELGEEILILRSTRYLARRTSRGWNFMNNNISSNKPQNVYTDLFDLVNGQNPVRLPVHVLCAQESAKGLKIAFLPNASDADKGYFYETIIPYEELKGLK
nr:MAG TPA: tail collar fiber protein [Caudoviricetes sp.]